MSTRERSSVLAYSFLRACAGETDRCAWGDGSMTLMGVRALQDRRILVTLVLQGRDCLRRVRRHPGHALAVALRTNTAIEGTADAIADASPLPKPANRDIDSDIVRWLDRVGPGGLFPAGDAGELSVRISRRRFLGGASGAWLLLHPAVVRGQEGVFLRAEDAPRHLFPTNSDVSERTVTNTLELQQRIRALLGRPPTVWEITYRIFTVRQEERVLGFVVLVEEIGKHRPITFAVGVNPDGSVHDLAVLAYREAYGGEVRERRFLKQYAGKTLNAPLLPYRDIRNIAGATLSVHATGRAARKAIAVLQATGDVR
jgi:hypothetical protein